MTSSPSPDPSPQPPCASSETIDALPDSASAAGLSPSTNQPAQPANLAENGIAFLSRHNASVTPELDDIGRPTGNWLAMTPDTTWIAAPSLPLVIAKLRRML